jgi:2-polyprenyl-6-methoxyphenol hydroxylase-like FAD-dependent oxidoreductase
MGGRVDAGSYDVAVVGGGIAGAALATAVALDGLKVLLLEHDIRYRDKVRGEYMAPWGVAEVQRLGLEKVLLAAGGRYVNSVVSYHEVLDPDEALAGAAALGRKISIYTREAGAPAGVTLSVRLMTLSRDFD